MTGQLMTRLGYSPDASRSEQVRWLVSRCEPLLLVMLSVHYLLRTSVWPVSIPVLTAAVAGCALGLFSTVYPTNSRLGMLRATVATLLLIAISLVLSHHLVDFVPWFSILGISYPLVFGLRRAYPFLLANAIGVGVAATSAFGVTSGLLRVPVVLIGGVLAGLVADALEQATMSATTATRDAARARTSENYLRTVLNTAPIGILVIGGELENSFMNARISHFLDSAPVLNDLEALRAYLIPDDRYIFDEMRTKVANGETATYSCRLELPQLGLRNVQIVAAPAIDDNGHHTGTVVIVRDMNDEVGRRREMERFRAVADATTDLVAIASFGDGANYLNPAGEKFFGANPLNRNDTLKFIPEEYRETMFAEIGEAIRDGGTWSGEIEMVDQDGERHPMSGVAVGIRDEQGHLEGFAVTYRDLSDRKRLEARLAHDAGHDTLTGLPNRQQLFDLLTNTIGDRERMAVMFCDLDDFKIVNDSLGHSVGDRLLQVVADRLQTATRGGDIVGRLGGDEFLVVCRNIGTDQEVAAIADRLLAAVKAPISLDGREHVVSMSVGVAFGIGTDPANEIVQRADLAMYAAKQAGRRRVAMFDQTMRRQVDDRLDMERELRAAFRDNQLSLHYQPIVNTGTREVLGFEALVRWQHPTRGLILPGKFMPIIESSGFSIQLGEFVLNEATRAASLLRLRSPNLSMSINLSAPELNNGDLVENVAKAITRAGIGASALTVEITEDIVMADIVAAKPQLDELHGLGVRIAIDDFGTGYSNLALLRQFAADFVKIDRSLISGLDTERGGSEFVRLILSLAHELGFAPIAEGVETEAQLDELRRLECKMAQGFLFAKPMTLADALAFASSGAYGQRV
ncbi:MAG: GGDEF domain-containing protein [Ilumatobacteraceae bacterium]|nr:GGDEF domain-containing protein [Ilumatobacteraceae bacterium]